MKKLITFGLCLMACTAVHAQSSVTLYGIVDAGFRFNSNSGGKQQYAIAGGNENASRFGLTGKEDLGGGYKAIFTLENGFNTTTGALQAGLMFGRQAFVGVASPYGTVTLGRQYLTLTYFLRPFEAGSDWAANGAGYGFHPGGLDDVDGTYRANNSIKYLSPDFHGLHFGGTYSLGGVAGDATRNEMISAGIGYTHGPFKTAAAYLYVKNPNYSLFGSNASTTGTGNNITSPVFSGYATAASYRVIGAGVSYQFGPLTAAGEWTNTRLNDIGGTAIPGVTPPRGGIGQSVTFNTGEASMKYYATPSLFFGLGYAYTRASSYNGQSGASYQQWALGGSYLLSKRTDLYLTLLRETAGGFDSTGHRAVAAFAFATPSTTNTQNAVTFGIRHLF